MTTLLAFTFVSGERIALMDVIAAPAIVSDNDSFLSLFGGMPLNAGKSGGLTGPCTCSDLPGNNGPTSASEGHYMYICHHGCLSAVSQYQTQNVYFWGHPDW